MLESVTMKTFYSFLGRYETQCEPAICSEELLGVTNQAGGTVKGKYFDNWYVICTSEQTHFPTNICDHATNKKPVLEEITH